jgi:toxin ParE1/3/4
MKVRFSRQARADLRGIVESISVDSPAAARRFRRLLSERALSLQQFPERGARLQGHPSARRLVVKPYLIVYRIDRNLVQILRIVHGRRDLRALLAREPQEAPDPATEHD